MSEPRAIPDEERPFLPEDPDSTQDPDAPENPETQGDDPLTADLGENGQGDLAPEDEADGFSGDAPDDLRGNVS